MKATHKPELTAVFNSKHRLEDSGRLIKTYQVIDLDHLNTYGDPDRLALHSLVECRIYTNASRTYNTACLWVHAEPIHTSGTGKAGGCGYHRPSAAVQFALKAAGFALNRSIDGVGDEAIREALIAVAREAGATRPALIESHP